MSFPTNPNDGDRYQTQNGAVYEYHSSDDRWDVYGTTMGATGIQGITGVAGSTGYQQYNYTFAFTSTPTTGEKSEMEGIVSTTMSLNTLKVAMFGDQDSYVDIKLWKREIDGTDIGATGVLLADAYEQNSNQHLTGSTGQAGMFYTFTEGFTGPQDLSNGDLLYIEADQVGGTPNKCIVLASASG